MPPKRGRGIVSSGNAGNSSKASKAVPENAEKVLEEKPLFPPGSKYPLSLLHERCQKSGWERPIVDTKKCNDGFSFVVILSKINKKSSQKESVRFEPHPPYVRPSALEARHWGATYALYRFCNGIQLNRVLPPGPRHYWNELVIEHKSAAEHMSWMYDADPFGARKAVDERQAKAARKREDAATANTDGPALPVSNEFAQAPEVKMASGLRDLVEDVIKKELSLYPQSADNPSVVSQDDAAATIQQLGHLGFQAAQARNAVNYLSHASPLSSNLLKSLSPLEACIEYLILHIPECDLPQRFLPSVNSSDPFITSAHSGVNDLKKRWIEDKAIKEAGWPAHIVHECSSNQILRGNWGLFIMALGRKLIGDDVDGLLASAPDPQLEESNGYTVDVDEIEAFGASFIDTTQLVMPLFSAPVNLNIVISPDIGTKYPPMYITSKSIPAYIRLHLLSQLLQAVKKDSLVQEGEGLLMAAMRVLEDAWSSIEIEGPPDISSVLWHLIPPTPSTPEGQFSPSNSTLSEPGRGKTRKRTSPNDNRSNERVKADFEAVIHDIRYANVLSARKKLPAFFARGQFIECLDKNRVVVVAGETGCGKTTQLPQFILDSMIFSNRGSEASIIITQPRRISAVSIAARVSSERLEDGSVGYAIRGESKQSDKTKLLFCTTGVMLRRLGSGDTLSDVTHVVVDEVHERSVDSDFLLLELKELLKKHDTLKIVLMSATINHETFIKYFDGSPLLTIPGFTHPVKDLYLEDIISSISYRPSITKSSKKENEDEKRALQFEYRAKGLDEQSIYAVQAIGRSDRLDYQLIAAVVEYITTSCKRGGILIFLPGVQEIRQCIEALYGKVKQNEIDVHPLHANLSNEEQQRVFAATSRWKIIAATNVAETSITIDDVIYVIDAGKVKETQYDPESGLSRLVETCVTRAAAKQRRGRAGRTQPGVCYKLYTRKQEEKMGKFPVPEILRVPLESLSLTVKVMREDEDVKLFLGRAIDPPNVAAMEKAWSVLEELGAIDQDGVLTALGRHMAALPVDLRLAKMLILGTVFQCLDPILTIAASVSSKPLFISPMDRRDEATEARARFATDSSDLLTDLNAYEACMRLRAGGKSRTSIRTFCEQNFISPTTLRDINSLRTDLLSALTDLGLIPFSTSPTSFALNRNADNVNLIKAIILGGLWPRVARVHLPKSAIKFDKVQAGTVQRENTAKEFKLYDLTEGRVFLHPGSVLFGAAAWKSPFLAYFSKYMTSKIFLRDATEVPLYALLLFGGPVSVNHVAGGLTIGTRETWIKLRAWPRIGILVNQLRRLLDSQLQSCVKDGSTLTSGQLQGSLIVQVMIALLAGDGLSGT